MFVSLVINYLIDRIFIQFLKLAKFTQILDYLIEKTTNILILIARVLVIINSKKARKVIERIENYYIYVDQIQTNYIICISKSSIFQSIIATIIFILIKKILDATFKNIEKLEIATIYKNLIQIALKIRETTTKKI